MPIINGRGRVGIRPTSGSGSSYDADAQAFFTANSTLTDVTQKNAINQFVLDLKSNNLWTLGKYMYLGFLGDSTRVKYNLFTPSSNVLTLSSGWTYDSQGMKGNGTSAYAQTGFIPSVSANKDSQSFGVYSQTNIDEYSTDLGSFYGGANAREHILLRNGGIAYVQMGSSGYYTPAITDSRGYFLTSRNSSSSFTMYKGTSEIVNNTASNTTINIPTQDYIGALNNDNTAQLFSTRKYSLVFRFTALTQTQSNNLNTCINTMLTTLSIPTY
jgi:hypothetical protein